MPLTGNVAEAEEQRLEATIPETEAPLCEKYAHEFIVVYVMLPDAFKTAGLGISAVMTQLPVRIGALDTPTPPQPSMDSKAIIPKLKDDFISALGRVESILQ